MGKKGENTRHEIYSQPQIWAKTVSEFNEISRGQLDSKNDLKQFIITGCGSTYYLSIWAARILQQKLGVVARPVPAAELWLSPASWISPDQSFQFIAISRSGTTSETVAALTYIKNNTDFNTRVVTCYPNSELALLADTVIATPSAQEKSIAQTRSFTNMMLGISTLINEHGKDSPDRLRDQGSALIDQYSNLMQEIANDKKIDRFFFLGSNDKYGLACEAMLKMKEMSLSYSEAYHFLEFRHGPMSMVNKKSLVTGLLGSDNISYKLQVLKDMKELGAKTLAIGTEKPEDIPEWIDYYIPLFLTGLGQFGDVLYLPCLQILSFERAIAKGLDPDNPTNLTAVVVLDK